MACQIGARGPQDVICPTAGALMLKGCFNYPASGQQFAAMAAADLGNSLHL